MPRKQKEQTHQGVWEKVKNSGVWWIRWTDARGKRCKKKIGTFANAVKVYDQRSSEARLNILLPGVSGRTVKFSELVADAITWSKTHHTDHAGFKTRVELAKLEFGDRIAETITTQEWQTWMDETAEEREWEHGTSNRYKSSLSTVYREAMRAGKVSTNPVKLVRRWKEPLGKVRFLDEAEESLMRQIIKTPMNGRINDEGRSALAQFDMALNTGMRRSEQFSVTMDQVNEKTKTIYLEKTKNGSDRHVKLNSEALRVIRELKVRHKELKLAPDALLFISKRNEPIKNPRKWFETVVAAAKIEGVTWHTLRHTFASRLVMEGVNLKTVQELMGHKTIAMTARYAHLAPGYLETELETLVQRRSREEKKAKAKIAKDQVHSGPHLVPGAFSDQSDSSYVTENKQ